MVEKLFVIHVGEDTGVRLEHLTESEFLLNLHNGKYGESEAFDASCGLPNFEVKDWPVGVGPDLRYWRGTLVIRGEVVIPQAKTTVTHYIIPPSKKG